MRWPRHWIDFALVIFSVAGIAVWLTSHGHGYRYRLEWSKRTAYEFSIKDGDFRLNTVHYATGSAHLPPELRPHSIDRTVFTIVPCVSAPVAAQGGLVLVRLGMMYARKRQGYCLHCGYDLTGNVSAICPECGQPVGNEDPEA